MKLSLISKYRTQLMGAAMIWIMFFHSPYFGSSEVVSFLHRIGFYGVDIFLMVSGLGLYFSMRRSRSVKEFYKKRAVRILPAYLLITVCWYMFYKTEVGLGDAVLSILGVNYFRGSIYGRPEYFDWFIPTLIVLYLLTPLYDKLFQQVESKWKLTALVSVISPVLCIIGYHTGRQVLYGSFVRIPIFLIGYYIGYFLYEKKEESKGSWMVHITLLSCGAMLAYYIHQYVTNPTVFWGLNAYPALLIAPSLSVLLGLVFLYMEKWLRVAGKILLLPFSICGRYSLEIYLIHQRLMEILNSASATVPRTAIIGAVGDGGYYAVLILLSVTLAAGLHELVNIVVNFVKKVYHTKHRPKTA